jgi:hypothetical protein
MRMHPDGRSLQQEIASNGVDLAVRLEGTRKQRRIGYLAWLCLGSHYLYLSRPFTQLLFWLTAGGILVWWFADFFRLPGLIKRHNLRAAAKLLESVQQSAERHVSPGWSRPPWQAHTHLLLEEAEAPSTTEAQQAPREPAETPYISSKPAWSRKRSSATILAAAMASAGTMFILTPPPLQSRAALEPTFQTIRRANVRTLPSTASRVQAVLGRNVQLKGRVETVGSSRWLWITRGNHADGYVALHNLEQR